MRLAVEEKKIVLVLEYDGTNYCGFQFQANAPTVQAEIEKAILGLTGETVRVVSASRTDSGVHAKGQVVSFHSRSQIPGKAFVNGLNFHLPEDIAVKASYKVNSRFSVRREAVSRTYRYFLLNSAARSPLARGQSYHVRRPLNVEIMNAAAQCLVGEHDFMSFVTDLSQSVIKSTLKTVYRAGVERQGEKVICEITASSFLPHQVRNTVGSLLKIGQGKINIDDFKSIMEARQAGLAGPTVPAHGLCLMQVNYPRPLGEYDEDL